MAISLEVDVVTTALWPQGDIRDPLGVWGFRLGVTGDASGGSIKVVALAPSGINAAYIYTCYSALIAQLSSLTSVQGKCRLLTNWPNVDVVQPGVQGYGSAVTRLITGDGDFTAPVAMPNDPFIGPADRFLLLFDPRASAGDVPLVELELGVNTDTLLYSFEGYGYYWDRSILQAPGGPRHPGAS